MERHKVATESHRDHKEIQNNPKQRYNKQKHQVCHYEK